MLRLVETSQAHLLEVLVPVLDQRSADIAAQVVAQVAPKVKRLHRDDAGNLTFVEEMGAVAV